MNKISIGTDSFGRDIYSNVEESNWFEDICQDFEYQYLTKMDIDND